MYLTMHSLLLQIQTNFKKKTNKQKVSFVYPLSKIQVREAPISH